MCDTEIELGETREIAPGVLVTRRCALATVAAVLTAGGAVRAQASSGGTLTFAAFLAEVAPVARKLMADTSVAGQQAYLRAVAAYAVRIADVPVPEMRDSGQGAGPGTFIGSNPGGDPFTVLHWRMEPGTRIRTHAHTYGNVVTLGLEGMVTVSNYEVVGTRDFATTAPFVARGTQHQRLARGQVNLVNLERDYIHGSVAGPNGARGLDLTTRIRPKAPTPYLILDDPEAARSKAQWAFDS